MTRTGSCLCGAIRYETDHEMGPVTGCHCTQCRKWTGHHVAALPVPWDALRLTGALTWYASSPGARRGFCGTCGSSLIWEEGDGLAYLMAGTLDAPTGLTMDGHVFCADAGDYYRLGDGLPRWVAGRSGPEMEA